MNKFPVIDHIDDVLPHIEGRPEFGVYEKPEGFTVINYNVAFEDTFPPLNEDDLSTYMVRECRGIKFDTQTGRVLARPFQKFFNIMERPETALHTVDLGCPHVIMDKLDGSMLHPIWLNNQIMWCSKMGVTDTANAAVTECITDSGINYNQFAYDVILNGCTPIFEYTTNNPFHRIVVAYGRPQLVLTAVRHNRTGQYSPPSSEVFVAAEKMGIPVVPRIEYFDNIDQMVKSVRASKGVEGIVIMFSDGRMLKLKSEEYCLLHRTKSDMMLPHVLTQLVLNGGVDDAIPLLPEADQIEVKAFESRLHTMVEDMAQNDVTAFYEWFHQTCMTRKELGEHKGIHPQRKQVMFKLKDLDDRGYDVVAESVDIRVQMILKNAQKMLKWETFCAELNLDPHLNRLERVKHV